MWLLSKLTWYWGIHHRLLLVSSGSDLVLAVLFSFPVGSCIFSCLGLLLLQVCFAPPICWRWEETKWQGKGKESVHFQVTTHVHCQTKPTEVHKECAYYQEGNGEGSRTKKKLTSTKFPEYTSSRVTSRSSIISLPLGISRPAGCLFPPNINPKSPKKLEKKKNTFDYQYSLYEYAVTIPTFFFFYTSEMIIPTMHQSFANLMCTNHSAFLGNFTNISVVHGWRKRLI